MVVSEPLDDLARSMAAGLSRRQMFQRMGVIVGGALVAALLPARTAQAQQCPAVANACVDDPDGNNECALACEQENPDCTGECINLRCQCHLADG